MMRAADGGSTRAENPVQMLDAVAHGPVVQPRPHGIVAARPVEQALDQGAEVEAGAADEDRQAPACGDLANACRRVARVLGRRVDGGRVDDVDEVMRDAAPARRPGTLSVPMSKRR